MNKIDGEVFSHIRFTEPAPLDAWRRRAKPLTYERGEWCPISKVRESHGYGVTSFRQLVGLVAELGYRNRRHNLLFRGQTRDYKDRNQRSNIAPGLFRPKIGQSALRATVLRDRFHALEEAVQKLQEQSALLGAAGPGLHRHREYQMALLQHYGLRKTPLLDATHSLRVATTFALPTGQKEGFLYVLGMPHAQGSISHFIDDDIVLVKLQNVCPPEALRPHYQEGYLLGRLSLTSAKAAGDNAAYRLLAKYRLDDARGAFWDDDFQPIPRNALLPAKDPFEDTLRDIVGADPVA